MCAPADRPPRPPPAAAGSAVDPVERFKLLLKQGGINARAIVLARLQMMHDTAFITVREPAAAVHWYEWARDQPLSQTMRRFSRESGYVLNGPVYNMNNMSLAYEVATGAAAIFKAVRGRDVAEVGAALALAGAPGLVPCTFHEAERDDGSAFCGLLMPKYERSLATVPGLFLPAGALLDRARVLLSAVRHVHARRFVHMDVKEANVFVGADGSWWLGDFGSCVREGAPISSTTQGLNPELAGWHAAEPPALARRRFDLHSAAGLLVRQLGAGASFAGDAGPTLDELRARAASVEHAELRSFLVALVEEAAEFLLV